MSQEKGGLMGAVFIEFSIPRIRPGPLGWGMSVGLFYLLLRRPCDGRWGILKEMCDRISALVGWSSEKCNVCSRHGRRGGRSTAGGSWIRLYCAMMGGAIVILWYGRKKGRGILNSEGCVCELVYCSSSGSSSSSSNSAIVLG